MIRSSKIQQGFTLIELMIGVVILALLISLVSFGLGRIVNQDLKNTQAELKVWLAELGQAAVILNQSYKVNVNQDLLSASHLAEGLWKNDVSQLPFKIPSDVTIQLRSDALNGNSNSYFIIDNTGVMPNQMSLIIARDDERLVIEGGLLD
ncbi:hypothetical protein XMG59_002236 [Marinobacterium sp. xm-g-59]|uniref:pilus assembly FimT family protein n=1 Tax=Marinobacterium sp. xm-g-59 TaxID=2497748 RepID=UPI001569E162|nr:type II secretion system protein [Marinobacterium sp. xm-g-59]NRP96118.1 hypothetical protein [Marinobacterium sp. xm-g-59]